MIPFLLTLAFVSGETAEYDIHWRIFGAGKARMTVVQDSGGLWHATVEAHSTGFVSRLYKVEDVFRSTFLNDGGCSEQIVKTIHEGGRHREVRIDFRNPGQMAAIRETDLARNRLVRQAENPIPPCAFDVVSALYHVRTRNLEIGKPFQVPLNDGSRTILVDVEVQAREEIRIPAGVFTALRLEPQVFGGTLFKRSGRMQIWLSDEPAHRLLQVKAKLFYGTVTAVLSDGKK